jgi:hypothetical protein
METDRIISLNKRFNKIVTKEKIKININKLKNFFYIFTFIILLNFLIFPLIFFRDKKSNNNLIKNINITNLNNNITKLIQNLKNSDDNTCKIIKEKLINRTHPLDFENELLFFIDLISCKIPFSFIRFGDGENLIMKGNKLNVKTDKWYWNSKNKKFQESLIESSSICLYHNGFIGIPCKNWIKISKSILSFSNCSSSKYMSYATLFINKNYILFKNWIFRFISTSNRWKIILVANSIIHKNISWAYKFFPVPDHLIENWDKYSISLLSSLSQEAKQNDLIFFISAGPAANIIISYLIKININNIYIDFGSSIEFITKGFSTRPYSENSEYSHQSCESFIFFVEFL